MGQDVNDMERTKKYLSTLRHLHIFACHYCHSLFASSETQFHHECRAEEGADKLKREFTLVSILLACKSCGYSMNIDSTESEEVLKQQIDLLKTLSKFHNCSQVLLLNIMATDGSPLEGKLQIQFCAVISPRMREPCCGKRFEKVREYRRHMYDHLTKHGKMAVFLKMVDKNATYNDNPQELLTGRNMARMQRSRESLVPYSKRPRYLLVDVLLRNTALDLADFMVSFELPLRPMNPFDGRTPERVQTCTVCHSVSVGDDVTPVHFEDCSPMFGIKNREIHTLVYKESRRNASIDCILCKEEACSLSGYRTHMILDHCRVITWPFSTEVEQSPEVRHETTPTTPNVSEPLSSELGSKEPEDGLQVARDCRLSYDELLMDIDNPSVSPVAPRKESLSPYSSNKMSKALRDHRDSSPFSPEAHQAVPDIFLQFSDNHSVIMDDHPGCSTEASTENPLLDSSDTPVAPKDSDVSEGRSADPLSSSFCTSTSPRVARNLEESSPTIVDAEPSASTDLHNSASEMVESGATVDEHEKPPDSPMSDALVMDDDMDVDHPPAAQVSTPRPSSSSSMSSKGAAETSPRPSDALPMDVDDSPVAPGSIRSSSAFPVTPRTPVNSPDAPAAPTSESIVASHISPVPTVHSSPRQDMPTAAPFTSDGLLSTPFSTIPVHSIPLPVAPPTATGAIPLSSAGSVSTLVSTTSMAPTLLDRQQSASNSHQNFADSLSEMEESTGTIDEPEKAPDSPMSNALVMDVDMDVEDATAALISTPRASSSLSVLSKETAATCVSPRPSDVVYMDADDSPAAPNHQSSVQELCDAALNVDTPRTPVNSPDAPDTSSNSFVASHTSPVPSVHSSPLQDMPSAASSMSDGLLSTPFSTIPVYSIPLPAAPPTTSSVAPYSSASSESTLDATTSMAPTLLDRQQSASNSHQNFADALSEMGESAATVDEHEKPSYSQISDTLVIDVDMEVDDATASPVSTPRASSSLSVSLKKTAGTCVSPRPSDAVYMDVDDPPAASNIRSSAEELCDAALNVDTPRTPVNSPDAPDTSSSDSFVASHTSPVPTVHSSPLQDMPSAAPSMSDGLLSTPFSTIPVHSIPLPAAPPTTSSVAPYSSASSVSTLDATTSIAHPVASFGTSQLLSGLSGTPEQSVEISAALSGLQTEAVTTSITTTTASFTPSAFSVVLSVPSELSTLSCFSRPHPTDATVSIAVMTPTASISSPLVSASNSTLSEPHLTVTSQAAPDESLSISEVLAAVHDTTFSMDTHLAAPLVTSSTQQFLESSDNNMDISPNPSPYVSPSNAGSHTTTLSAPPGPPGTLNPDYGNTSNLNDDTSALMDDANFCSDAEKCRVLVVGNVPEVMASPDKRSKKDFKTIERLLFQLGVICHPSATQRVGPFTPLRRRLIKVLLQHPDHCDTALQNVENLSKTEEFKYVWVKALLSDEERKRLRSTPTSMPPPGPNWHAIPPPPGFYTAPFPFPPPPPIPRIFFQLPPSANPRPFYQPPYRY